jgi:PAS domain S-box-containing protein
MCALVKALQTISSQIVLDRLLDTLLRIAIENAGAQKGYLLLWGGKALLLAAEGCVEGKRLNVRVHREGEFFEFMLPASILARVRDSREKVVLADAAAPNPFSDDEYLSRQHPKSILCLPIVMQADLVGLLYLENNLAPHAFTPDRLTALELIAAQAAISLENARLYSYLLREDAHRRKAEAALVLERNLLRTLVENMPDRIYAKDTQSRFIFGNLAVAHFMGAAIPEDLLGKTDYAFFPPEFAQRYFADEQAVVRSGQPLIGREEPVTDATTGEVRWLLTTKVPLRDAEGNVTGIVGIGRDITERKRAEEALRESAARLHSLSGYLQSVREEQSAKIAHEVHDELGGTLTMLKLGLASVLEKVEQPKAVRNKLSSLLQLTNGAIQTVKRISTSLRPSLLDTLGLMAAIKWHANEFSKLTGIRHELSMPEPVRLSPERSIAVFRIIQEALTNIARHAGATLVTIRLWKHDSRWIFEIADDGKGIADDPLNKPGSFGVLGMHERSQYLGAELEIRSAPDEGTTVTLRLPPEPG